MGSALVEWWYRDERVLPFPEAPHTFAGVNAGGSGGDTHECVRHEDAAQRQLVHFLDVGEVIQTCNGVCGHGRKHDHNNQC